jgi:uncharacterized membrane protein SpoIIM required for sporulation
MNREALIAARREAWARLDALLRAAEQPTGVKVLGPGGVGELAGLYRGLASDLMRVRRDRLGADLEAHLDTLAARAHNALYAGSRVGGRATVLGALFDFPGAVRRNARFVALAALLFFGTGALAAVASYADESYALAVLSPGQLAQMESMYRSGQSGRSGDANAAMTGFYVWNNVGIAFRCFATGALFGLGPIFFLIFNGLTIGTVLGHLARSGYGENIFSFIFSHAPWELSAIVLSGAAGLQMGHALVVTGGRTRLGNLGSRTLELVRQVLGAAAFLLLAAGIEAWYSPSALPPEVKYATGALGWLAVALILAFGGRRRPVPEDVVLRRGRA